MILFELFNRLESPKLNNKLNRIGHTNHLINMLASQFEYRNLPEEVNHRFLEIYLMKMGLAGFTYDKKLKKYVAFPCTRTGDVDEYGLGKNFIGAYPYKSTEGVIGVDGIVIQNNVLALPDTDIYYTVDTLTELQKSIRNNIKYSRMCPIPIVRNQADYSKMKEILKKIDNGVLDVVTNGNLLEEIDSNVKSFDILNITDVNASEKLANLSRMYDDVMKVFYNTHGQALQTQNKSAQQTTDEIHGMDSTSFIYPLAQLKERKEAFDKVNELYGLNVQVDFSDAWKREYERFMNTGPEEPEEPEKEGEEDVEL